MIPDGCAEGTAQNSGVIAIATRHASLRDLFVAPYDKNFRTIEAKGQTIYLYNQNSATWVNGEIWYMLVGDGSLSGGEAFEGLDPFASMKIPATISVITPALLMLKSMLLL